MWLQRGHGALSPDFKLVFGILSLWPTRYQHTFPFKTLTKKRRLGFSLFPLAELTQAMMFRNFSKFKEQRLKNGGKKKNRRQKSQSTEGKYYPTPHPSWKQDQFWYSRIYHLTWYTVDRYPQRDFIEQTQLGNIEIALRVQKPEGLTDQLRDLEQISKIVQPSFYSHTMEIIPFNAGSSKSEIRSSLERHFIIYKALKHHIYVYIWY